VELIREVLPRARRVALLWDSASRDQATVAQAEARRLALATDLVEIRGSRSPVFVRDQVTLGRLLVERRLPASLSGALREIADYVARIAKGARPSDLPIEQSRSFELLVNIKTAKVLDIAIPPALLARADEVIK
jgi:putative tryptophan/tyrosine transport system substrate-binding protein